MIRKILLSAALAALAAPAMAAVDVVAAPTGFFVPTDAQKYDFPYYRYFDGDWGYMHNGIGGAITAASLSISAFDVDACGSASCEHDNIYANDSGTWLLLGELAGGNNIWQFTSFVLGSNFYDDIASGLKVKIDIDSTHASNTWAVTLGKSTLTTEGEAPGNPNPGVPEPATWALMLIGFFGLGSMVRRQRKLAAA